MNSKPVTKFIADLNVRQFLKTRKERQNNHGVASMGQTKICEAKSRLSDQIAPWPLSEESGYVVLVQMKVLLIFKISN